MRPVLGYAAAQKGAPLAPWRFERRDVTADDIAIRILYCGVCHSDLHAVHGGMGAGFPLVPGHEIVGEVVEVGTSVERFAVGDRVVMGTVVDSCRHCRPCRDQTENYCAEGPTQTFGSPDRKDGRQTNGGYSTEYVLDQWFAYPFPAGLDPAGVAPLLCAGITVWSPLRHWKIGEGSAVGVIGLGGLGHMAIKFAHALGATVTAFTTSPAKVAEARRLGADAAVVSSDEEGMKALAGTLDFITSTAPASIDYAPYLAALKQDGTLCVLGVSGEPVTLDTLPLTMRRLAVASSGVGGTRETDEMLSFCARHGITADVEVIPMDQINEAFKRLEKNDVRYRFVIDMASLDGGAAA